MTETDFATLLEESRAVARSQWHKTEKLRLAIETIIQKTTDASVRRYAENILMEF